jgi:hypothetical protein
MSISSTGIYGVNSTIVTSDLYEDVETLKSNLTITFNLTKIPLQNSLAMFF